MKTKITLLIGAVALVTLSFTFASVDNNTHNTTARTSSSSSVSTPVGGLMADEVVK